MNYATVKPYDVANGPGVRVSLFVSGCPHHCKDCFNPETWDFAYGEPYTSAVTGQILSALAPDYIRGFSLLGGEPMAPANQADVLALLRQVRAAYPDKTVWIYSGYVLEALQAMGGDALEILKLADVLVDGPFVAEKKNLSLRFRGSENQRLIDLKKTLATGQITIWEDTE